MTYEQYEKELAELTQLKADILADTQHTNKDKEEVAAAIKDLMENWETMEVTEEVTDTAPEVNVDEDLKDIEAAHFDQELD